MLIILICVAILSISSNTVLEKQFKEYVIGQREQTAREAVALVNQRFNQVGDWDIGYIENIGMNALENGMIIKIIDSDETVIWDATVHNHGLCEQMLTNMQQNMQNYFSETEGGYEEERYDLEDGSIKIGSVIVGYYGPYYYTDSDLYFINSINHLLMWAGAISLLFALILGVIISKQLTKPISRVIEKASGISEGLYGKKIEEKSKTKEISQLVETVNNLAETLNKQQQTSRQASLDIAHELRTPLTTVQGNLEAVIDGVMELDNHRLDILYDEILRINRLVDDLGKLARYERESVVLNKREFNVSQLIQRVIQQFESDFINQNKQIIFTGKDVSLFADMDKINQMMINLIANALKFTKPNGKVEINVNAYQDMIEISVKDNGIGIAEEDLENVFERFYRSDKSRKRQSGGAGIGLTIVRSIVLAHNGTIKLNSEINKGSKFIITLPIRFI